MANIVLVRDEKIDYDTTIEKAVVLNSSSQLALESVEESETFVLPSTEQNVSIGLNENFNMFVPSTIVKREQMPEDRLYVYFDLENYPFFKKLSEVVKKEERKKGVFRYRKTVSHNEDTILIASDLYVLASLFGELENVVIKDSNRAENPYHIILMVNFSGGTMAHLEYTFSGNESIEIDWSGIKKIVEFNSKEMSPIKPDDHTALPLSYNIDSILASAHRVDQQFINRLNNFRKLVEGGIQ